MVYHGKGTRTQLKVALEGGYGHLVIYGHFTSYFIAECFMHHVNLYVIRVLVELMLCDEKLGKNVLFFFSRHASVVYWFCMAWFGCPLLHCHILCCHGPLCVWISELVMFSAYTKRFCPSSSQSL